MNQSSKINNKIFYGILSGACRIFVQIITTFVQVKLIFQFLPKDMSGTWFLFLSMGYFIAFFDLGISPTISREISFILGRQNLNEQQRNREIADIIATCLLIFQIIALVVFLLGLIVGGLFLWRVAPAENYKEIGIAWFIFTLGASLNILGGAGFAALYGMGNITTERVIRTISQLFGLGMSALCLYMGLGIIGLAVAWIIQSLTERAAGWIGLNRFYPVLKSVRGKASTVIAKKISLPSIKWAATGLGAILILQTDNLIIATTIGTTAIPPYEAVTKIINTLASLSILIVTSSTPFLSNSYAAKDTETFNTIFFRNIRYGMALMIILVSYLAVFGDQIVDIWLGPGNFVGFYILWTLLIVLTLEVHHVIHATAAMASGHIIFFRVAILASVIKVLLSLILVKYFGLWGVALGTMIAQMITNNWYVPYLTLMLFRISLKFYFRCILFKIGQLLSILIIVNIVIKIFLGNSTDLLGIFIAFFISSFLGLILIVFLIMTKLERRTIWERAYNWRMK